jgi:HAD superfamily phosphoserine phosphatase-like hydrolase
MTRLATPAFSTVVLDVDSTVSGIEGVDWLAARRGPEVARRIAGLTAQAMRGEIPLEQVYGTRLSQIRPRREDLDALARAYVEAMAPDTVSTVHNLRRAGVQVVLVSGGLRNALLRLALELDLDLGDVHAVDVRFDAMGAYVGFDEKSPLSRTTGKSTVIAGLDASRPMLMVGDGVTDLAARSVVDSFAAFTGFVSRDPVVRQADVVLKSFAELETLVLG